MEFSNIDRFLKNADFGDNKMLAFIFKEMCKVKEEQSGKPLTMQELNDFKLNLEERIEKNKFSKNELFNLILSNKYTQYEKKSGKRLRAKERAGFANELAKELGVEENICRAPYLLCRNGDKIRPTDNRRLLEMNFQSRIRYARLFKEMGEDKRTIKGFSRRFLKLKPLSKGQITLRIISALLGMVTIVGAADTIAIEFTYIENACIYAKEIDDYETRMEKYTEQLKEMNLSDIDLVMKVVDDMHSNIRGIGNPKINATGFFRLDAGNQDGVVVCRNAADNTTYILNRVRPELNAGNMMVHINGNRMNMANIDVKKVEEISNENNNGEEVEENVSSNRPNHLITAFDVPNCGYRLVVDTLNPAIGVLTDGKIIMLNEMDGNMEYTPLSEAIMGIGGRINMARNLISMNTHSTHFNINLEELIAKWGIEAQNDSLARVREIPGAIEMAKVAYTSTLKEQQMDISPEIAKIDDEQR